MSNGISVASVLGALGLFLAGQHWIAIGLRSVRPSLWQRLARPFLQPFERGAGQAGNNRTGPYLSGLTCALATPSSSWSTQVALGSVHRGGRSLEQAVWQIIGSCAALAATAWLVLGAQRGAGVLEPAGWLLMGVGGVLFSTLPRARSMYWIALGSGACLLGWVHLDAALADLSGTRLDAWGLAMPARLAVATLIGLLATALLRSPGAVLSFGLLAADHGTVHLTTGLALFAGASLGSLAASRSAWTQGGDPQARRASVAAGAFQGLVACLTFLSLALGLPLLGDPPAPFDQPIFLLASWSALLIVGATLVAAPLVRPAVRVLETRLGLFDRPADTAPAIDRAMLTLPTLTLDCLRGELDGMRQKASSLARRVLGEERVSDFRTQRDIETVAERARVVADLADEILNQQAPEELRRLCSWAPAAGAAFLQTCRQMDVLRRPDLQPSQIPDSALRARVLQFRWGFLHFVEHACALDTHPLQREQERHQLEVQGTDLAGRLLRACGERTLEPLAAHAVLAAIDALRSTAHGLATALAQAEPRAQLEAEPQPETPSPDAPAAGTAEEPAAALDLEEPAAALPTGSPTGPRTAAAPVGHGMPGAGPRERVHTSLFAPDQPARH